jgi:hypothetical protein
LRLTTRRHSLVALIAALATLMITAVPAQAASGASVIADCNANNRLTHHYTIAELANALETLPADVSEYTSCHDVIQRQLLVQEGKAATSGGTPVSTSAGGSALPTPLIVVIVVLLVAAATLGAVAIRRRRARG